METEFLHLLSAMIAAMPELAVLADAAPPGELIIGMAVAAIIGLGLFVAVIVVISVLVIRAIKKSRTPKTDA